MPPKKEQIVIYGSGQTWELLCDLDKYPHGSKEREGWLKDRVVEHEYFNEMAIYRNELILRQAKRLTEEELRRKLLGH